MKEPKRYYCGNGEGMFEDDKNGHWVEYSEHKAIVDALTKQFSEIRQVVADYMWSEGCSCCRADNHDENGERLAVLLGVKRYEDGSGYDWESVRKQ